MGQINLPKSRNQDFPKEKRSWRLQGCFQPSVLRQPMVLTLFWASLHHSQSPVFGIRREMKEIMEVALGSGYRCLGSYTFSQGRKLE